MRLYEKIMRTALFDFELPPDRIALRPVSPRDAARLLVVRPGQVPELEDRGARDLPDLLRAGDALVVNDTKVIAARLRGRRIGRGSVEPAIEAKRTQPRGHADLVHGVEDSALGGSRELGGRTPGNYPKRNKNCRAQRGNLRGRAHWAAL